MRLQREADELTEWTDPDGLVSACTTCFDAPLTHGPMIGAVGSDHARIWLRTDATRQVTLRVTPTAAELTEAAPVAIRYPAAAQDFT